MPWPDTEALPAQPGDAVGQGCQLEDLAAAERAAAAGLVVPVLLRGATVPVDIDDLTAAERRQLPDAGSRRRQDWLLGRAALKQVVEGGDTSLVRFPHRCLSLTHSAGIAVAARADGGQAGVGVDYEGPHDTDPRIAPLFLVGRERDAAAGPDDLLRLWTVKEALFKATPDNLGATFLDYEVAEPAALIGEAEDRAGRRLRYVSGGFGGGWLSVAVGDAAV
jgi:hypothetical protein